MSDLAPEVWFPVVTLVVGASIGAITQSITDWRAAEREKLARHEQRQDAARDRRIEFQRATLLELQERVGELIRAASEASHTDEMVFKETGRWRSTLLPDGVSQRFFLAQTSSIKLRERVSDEQIRQLAKELSEACVEASMAESQQKSRSWMVQASDISGLLNMRIGEQLRTLDNIEDAAIAKK